MTTQQNLIILPSNVDDPYGFGVKDALKTCGIDRDELPELADIIEAEWWRCYGDAAAEALQTAGYGVIRTSGSIGSADVDELERRYADELFNGDELPIDMVIADRAAKEAFWAWWQDNAETLCDQHGGDYVAVRAIKADPVGVFRETLESVRIERNVLNLCSGFDFEAFSDAYRPDLDDVKSLDEADALLMPAANACVDAWLAMTPAERAQR